ncbi:MAG: taurine dioxygenase [Candidatus Azotimanducaceae bacterium]|jgi:taurine dioxygenase
MSQIHITPISGALGADISGVDLSAPLSSKDQAQIDAAFHEHLVLCFRDQHLSPESLLALTQQLGGVGETPYLTGLADYPDVVPIIKEAAEKSAATFGAGWHTDFTFQQCPPSRTLLYAVDVPAAGGDTLYANLYAAYDALSTGMKDLLEHLTATHSATRSYGPEAKLKDRLESMTINNDSQEPATMTHPVIQTHPVTGRKALWINPVYTLQFTDMTQAESAPLLKYLNDLIVMPSFTCRVRWHKGSLTMWDNRCTQHCATADYHGQRREMLRTTVAGEQPF